MRLFSLLFFVFLTGALIAQDAYHTALQSNLMSEYSLPAADWMFYDSEATINSNGVSYGHSSNIVMVENQAYSQVVRHNITSPGSNPWDQGWNIRNQIPVQQNDKVLVVFNIRSIDGPGKVNFFVENATTYAKEVILTLDIGEEWRQYLVPFSSTANYGMNGLSWGFHFAFQTQTIEVGGFTALNYDNDVALGDLPDQINNQFYGGWEDDAPWRAAAAARIEELRKADFNIEVRTTAGMPVANAAVHIEMQRHEFAFGTAITASRLPGSSDPNVIYQNKLLDLDGEGHGFNWVVHENDLKWPAWESEWFVNKTQLVNGIEWLRDNDIEIRGHNLVWPGEGNLPNDIVSNSDNLDYVRNRIDSHLEEILTYPGVGENIAEWDVLNELVTNRFLENAFNATPGYPTGREIYQDIFEKIREVDPSTGLWLNDYVTISIGNGPGSSSFEFLKQITGELVDAGVDIEGIGFQCHVGGFPNGIPSVLNTFDDFYNDFGLKAKVTEFDLPAVVNEELAATYLNDFLTATFSHPSMDGFLFWSFWDGATYMNPGANFFRQDWTPTPALDAFNNLVFDEWWTDAVLTTDANGLIDTRVFKGTYEIAYTCEGEEVREVIEITEASNLTITCDNITTDVNEPGTRQGIKVYPNPSNGNFRIENPTQEEITLRVYDAGGKTLLRTTSAEAVVGFNLNAPKGVYWLEATAGEEVRVERIVVE